MNIFTTVLAAVLLLVTVVAAQPDHSGRYRNWQFPVDDGSIAIQAYTFPGRITQYWWVSDQDVVVLANGHLFLSREYASTGQWESLTEDIPELQANNSRVPGMGLVKNIQFYQPEAGEAQDMLFVETLTSTMILSILAAPSLLVGQISLETVPVQSPIHGTTPIRRPMTAGMSIVFDSIVFHPTQPDIAVGVLQDPNCAQFASFACKSFAYITSPKISPDMPFTNWRLLQTPISAMQLFFGTPLANATGFDADKIFLLSKPTESSGLLDGQMFSFSLAAVEASATASVMFTEMLGSTFGEETLGKFIVIAAADDKRHIGLYLSDDNMMTGLHKANFGTHIYPSDIHPYDEDLDEQETGYTVVDVADEVFINVYRGRSNTQQRWGHTYASGQSGRRFSLSLPYNRRLDRAGAAVDFHRVAGITGVIVANIVLNPQDEHCRACSSSSECDRSCEFGTVFSRDNGKSWQRISPPYAVDGCPALSGTGSDSVSSGQGPACSLHLHSYSSAYVFNSHPIVSTRFAPGLIIATGNEGESLDLREDILGDSNVYISRDAGETWNLLFNGAAIYGETDYGGVLYSFPAGRKSRHVNLSIDEGATWTYAPIAPEGTMFVFSTIISTKAMPSAHFVNVLALGDGSNHDAALFVDLSNLKSQTCLNLDTPNTPDSDFEYFQPSSYFDNLNGGFKCFMGEAVSYVRKKFGHRCWVDVPASADGSTTPGFLLPRNAVPCACSKEDYECDVNFVEFGENCVLESEVYSASQGTLMTNLSSRSLAVDRTPSESTCEDGQMIKVITGYRKLSGDQCVGGVDLSSSTVPCPPSRNAHIAGYLSIAVLCVVGALLFVWQRAQSNATFAERVSRIPCLKVFVKSSSSTTSTAGRTYAVVAQEDDESDSHDDEERALTAQGESRRRQPLGREVHDEGAEELATARGPNPFSVAVTVEGASTALFNTTASRVEPSAAIPVAEHGSAPGSSLPVDSISLFEMEPPPLQAGGGPALATSTVETTDGSPNPKSKNLDFLDWNLNPQ